MKLKWENDEWKFFGVCFDWHNFEINGVNVWGHKWKIVDRSPAKIEDPRYGQSYKFDVCEIDVDGKRIEFAAGEFSNGVWGFYLRNRRLC